ncbi:hypothetical protein [Roseivirga misakiensis]|uniref:Uncharacterized protein n=1 Tax=Roseivirga misakiensis TaxID=1563681 RepID=A0A1E5SKA4_9BACT|nr:hypothetical protein [Roseivirga misakiensis]OEJ99531.1 hypothetical protein BFP71_08100 [Roseivirga misakiensis]
MKELSLKSMENISGSKFFGWTDWECGEVVWYSPFQCGKTCTRTYHAFFIRTKTEVKSDIGLCIRV